MTGLLLVEVFLAFQLRNVCRKKSVLLIEKNDLWLLKPPNFLNGYIRVRYTLADNLLTLRYLLGATDDLLQFTGFPSHEPGSNWNGVDAIDSGWFNGERIRFKYRIPSIWMALF